MSEHFQHFNNRITHNILKLYLSNTNLQLNYFYLFYFFVMMSLKVRGTLNESHNGGTSLLNK
jgi:hypothetical protein